jgi:hypothetical protein
MTGTETFIIIKLGRGSFAFQRLQTVISLTAYHSTIAELTRGGPFGLNLTRAAPHNR